MTTLANSSTQSTQPQEKARLLTWVRLWRLDGIFNILMGDAFIFATGFVSDTMGLSDDANPWIRAVGVAFAIYGLWQLWTARSGKVAKLNYLIADLDMAVLGSVFILMGIIGVGTNALGTALLIGFGASGLLLAALWYTAYRQAE